jgi:hypothetical protein
MKEKTKDPSIIMGPKDQNVALSSPLQNGPLPPSALRVLPTVLRGHDGLLESLRKAEDHWDFNPSRAIK